MWGWAAYHHVEGLGQYQSVAKKYEGRSASTEEEKMFDMHIGIARSGKTAKTFFLMGAQTLQQE